MVPKKQRINRETFDEIMKKGRIVHSGLFSLRFLKNLEKSTHFSVVVSKKIAKTAVLRNKIRRRIYSILRKTIKNPYFVILFTKKGVEKAKFSEVKTEIEKIAEKL